MKFVPMIVALSVGTVAYADAFGLIDARSLMHPKSPRHAIAIDLTDAPKDAPELGEVVITKEILWDTELRKATMLADDAGDEEKRLFWHTVWGDQGDPRQDNWTDPNPTNWTIWQATHSPDAPPFYFLTDEPQQRHSETAALEVAPPPIIAGPVLPSLGAQKVIQTVKDLSDDLSKDGKIDVKDPLDPDNGDNPVLVVVCTFQPSLPACALAGEDGPGGANTPPTLPGLPTGFPEPPVVVVGPIGGQSGGQIGGLGSPVPEPSTWLMLLVGFAGLGWAVRRRRDPRLRVPPQRKRSRLGAGPKTSPSRGPAPP